MDGTTEALDWGLIGEDPVPGDPDSVLQVADAYRRRSLLALRATESTTSHAQAVGGGWNGATADAYRTSVGQVAPEVSVMVDAATRAGNELAGFAEVMRSLQSQATDILAVAGRADHAQAEAEHDLAALHAQQAVAAETQRAARLAWIDAQGAAETATAIGSPEAGHLQSRAVTLSLKMNDANTQVAVVETEIVRVESVVTEAASMVQSARSDAQRLAVEFAAAAALSAASLLPVPPFQGGVFGTPNGGATTVSAAGPPPAGPSSAIQPLGPGPAAVTPIPIPGSGADVAMAPRPAMAGRAIPSGSTVRVASILAAVRIAGGRPIAVATVHPTQDVFRQFQRLGLQAVTARGAAMARALGFEGAIGGLGHRPTPTDHSTGLAMDLMTYGDVASGEALAQFFRENHEALGVTYVIFNGRICSARQDWEWRPYSHPAGRTDATAMHLDHVHISFDPTENPSSWASFGLGG